MASMGEWNILFCIICWLLWRRRNERTHQGITLSVIEALSEIFGIARCMSKSTQFMRKNNSFSNSNPEREGNDNNSERVFEVSVDGAYSKAVGVSGCGGIISCQDGGLMEAFTCGIKARNSFEAELWGCICGLRRAWNLNIKNCRIWTDSMEMVELQNIEDFVRHESVELITEFKLLLERDWRVHVLWRCREENVYVDLLAKHALQLVPGLCLLTRDEAFDFFASLGIT